MIDLSHWNSATEFTGEAAAALAVGIDPAQPEYRRTISKPLYERMERHFNEAKRLYQEEVVGARPIFLRCARRANTQGT